MITPGYAQVMAGYNAEMNRRVYGAALRLSDAERRADRGLFWRSIHGTLSHVYWADVMWLSRFGACDRPEQALAESDRMAEDFAELWALRQDFDAALAAWADALEAADLEGDLEWWSGAVEKTMVKPRALLVAHIFNHQTHHRGQAHAALTAAGEATDSTDLAFLA